MGVDVIPEISSHLRSLRGVDVIPEISSHLRSLRGVDVIPDGHLRSLWTTVDEVVHGPELVHGRRGTHQPASVPQRQQGMSDRRV